MLKESQLFSLLDKVLGQTAYIRKGEEAVYFCPFCSHYKKKLEVNVRTQEWHCWICNSCGKSIRSLFYKLKAKDKYFDELYKIVGKTWKQKEKEGEQPINLSLPDEFVPLWEPSKSFDYGHAMSYLQDRRVTMDDILRYNIGYCEGGIYRQRVLVPSYDRDGNINFFSARAYQEGNSYKYMLSPWPKDIVGFELFINWDEPITIVEGVFDAMAIRNNAIPLFGTTLTFALKLAIIKNKVKRVNIVLDNDALKQAVDIFDRIEDLQINQIDIHLIRLGEKDPSILGFEVTNKLIEKSKAFEFSDIIKARLER
jgi:transcription elongation factor Elf1